MVAYRVHPRLVFSFAALLKFVALSEHREPYRALLAVSLHALARRRLASPSTAAPDAEADEGAVS